MKYMAIFSAIVLSAGAAMAADVTVTIHNVNDQGGEIRAGLCDKPNWLTYHCPFHQRVDTKPGDVTLTFKNVPPGDWGVIAYHDANLNGKLDENFLGIPIEQFGFSNNPGHNHQPDFSESVFKLDKSDVDLSIDFNQ
jgi:uncharacterized protein (DUF2141 family)